MTRVEIVMLVLGVVTVGFVSCQERVVISNRSQTTYFVGSQLFEAKVPEELQLRDVKVQPNGSTTVTLIMRGALNAAWPMTIEAYFDVKGEKIAQSRVIIATFGGYPFGDLPGDGTGAAFARFFEGSRLVWKRVGAASVEASKDKVTLSADLGVEGAVPNLIIVRFASPDVWELDPGFRFGADGIAATVQFRADEIRGRPLPRLPDHPN
jgi:hypothetical protein